MSKSIAWHKRIGVRLGGVTLLLLAVSLLLAVGNYYTLASMQGDAASLALFGKGRMQLYQLLYLAHNVAVEQNDASSQARTELEDMDKAFEDRFRQLEKGDPAQGVPAATDPIILNEIRERKQAWEEKMKPIVDGILKATKRDDAAKDAAKDLPELDALVRKGLNTLEAGITQYQEVLAARAAALLPAPARLHRGGARGHRRGVLDRPVDRPPHPHPFPHSGSHHGRRIVAGRPRRGRRRIGRAGRGVQHHDRKPPHHHRGRAEASGARREPDSEHP